jgi:ABC-type branched-subunit amino acid transport system permease subunit
MHGFAIAADVIMGLILGLFLHVAISRIWSALDHPAAAVVVFGASVLLVLFRKPNGSLRRVARR